jgi:hypothetical protein
MANLTAATNISALLKDWRTLKGDHYCPACWKEKCKNLTWQKALEQSHISAATSSIVDSSELVQADGYVACIGCKTMILIR